MITSDSHSERAMQLIRDIIEHLIHASVALPVRSEAMRSEPHRATDALATSELITVLRCVHIQ